MFEFKQTRADGSLREGLTNIIEYEAGMEGGVGGYAYCIKKWTTDEGMSVSMESTISEETQTTYYTIKVSVPFGQNIENKILL